MEQGDEAEHQRHPTPFILGQAVAKGDSGSLCHNLVHGKLLLLDANDLQEGKVNREFACSRVEITAGRPALGLQCGNLLMVREVRYERRLWSR